MNLLAVSNDAKTVKGETRGYLTGILYLQPWKLSGKNLCAFASPGCIASCLNTAGRGTFESVQRGRARKTRWFLEDRAGFMRQLVRDIAALERKAARLGLTPVVRLNGTSDIPWESVRMDGCQTIFQAFPHVQFYDYTKNPTRKQHPFPNYHLTFSRSETNEARIPEAIANGMNVAVVFHGTPPAEYAGLPTVNGDASDLRFADPRGVVVALRAKGRARRDTSGFVVRAC